uniref:Uncharacterized protein n=1 Tax=Myoviridae sp. ct78050 TaxID=2826617 RepID=A0A8S5R224_9CAUD|nr:MAG TPA: hypothetical protein [Myoviridae sp. ct78050]
MIPPLGYKRWVVNEAEQTLDLYCSTKFGMQCLAIIEQIGDSTFECHLQKQRCAYTKEVLHGTVEEVKAKIENDIIQSFKKELNRLKRAIGVYENFIAIFTEEEMSSEIALDECFEYLDATYADDEKAKECIARIKAEIKSIQNKLKQNKKKIRLLKKKHKSDQEYIRLLEKKAKLYE